MSQAVKQVDVQSQEATQGWQKAHVFIMLTLAAAAVALTWRGWFDFAWRAFNDEESSHFLLVPLVIAYLLWQQWALVLKTPPRPGWVGPLTLALGIGMWEYSYRYSHITGDHLGAILVLAGVIICVTGDRFVYRFWPILFLPIFLVSLSYFVRGWIAIPLQRVNAAIAYEIFAVFGLDILRYGSVIEINSIQVGVAEACNGMRSILAILLVCYAMAFATRIRTSARILLLAATPIIALAANLVRLLATVLVYGYGSKQTADMMHDLFGWATIALAFVFVWVVITLARWLMIPIDVPKPTDCPQPLSQAATTQPAT